MAIDRLPSGSFRARLMIGGQRYTATLPTEADARLWEVETRAAAAGRRRAAPMTFADYATGWFAGFIDDAPDRARFEAALAHRLLPVLGELPLFEVIDADRNELHRRRVDVGRDGGDGATRERLQLIWRMPWRTFAPGFLTLVHPAGRVGPVVEPSGGATMFGLGGRLAPADRTARGVAGVGLIVAGVLLGVFGARPAWVTALIIGIGVVLVAEATLNHCPAAKVRPWNLAQSEKASQGS